jgi:FKBP-type peptidyl-prolyl cis-trans isomerase FkpA
MKLKKISLLAFCFIIGLVSCKKDDNSPIPEVEVRDRTEQQIADNDSILKYLNNHYYNSSDFGGSNLDPSIQDLVISELLEGETVPSGHTLLKDAVGTPKTVVYENTDYEIYVLKLNIGGGESPKFSDNVLVNYEGFTLEDYIFDGSVNPVTFDLTSLIPGWRKVLTDFKTAESFADNVDGTVNFINHGLGVMFLPSGLAYFSGAPTGVSSYSPLIFKFELLQMAQNDHDGDGVPSYLEDLNGDGEYTINYDDLTDVTDDDTDGDGIPNYADTDDDGDGILTINEDINGDGDPTNDIGKNGIPRYLDPEEKDSK